MFIFRQKCSCHRLDRQTKTLIMNPSVKAVITALLFTTVMLITPVHTVPVQCVELRNIIPACNCEARVYQQVEIDSQVIINCRNLNLSTIPEIRGSSQHIIYEMTLRQNNIQVVPAAAFSGLKIQRLDLRDNRLHTFDSNAFQGLKENLEELYLGAEAGANIQTPVDALSNLTSLRVLHLERFTFHDDEIVPGNLNRLTSLEELVLVHNGLIFVDSGSLPPGLTSFTLTNQNLTTLPLDALRSLTHLERLTITYTKINAISNNVFDRNTQLSYLDLGYNKISVLYASCFAGITESLRTLSLRNNPLPDVTSINEIQALRALTSLRLSDITLGNLPQGADFLINKGSLEHLYLDGNSLSTLESDVFSELRALTHLDLASNQLVTINDHVFSGLSSLEYLDLSHQTSPRSLTLPTSLTSLTSLKTLKLTSTHLSHTTLWERISPITTLQILSLEEISLTSVPDYILMNLTQLTELHLDNNDLTALTQQMLAGPRGLEKLMLNNNQITTISSCAFHGFELSPALLVGLLGNQLHCDCRLRWLLEEIQAQRVELSGFETCSTPPDKAGILLSRLQPEEVTCVSSPEDPPCLELYTTPEPTVTTQPPAPQISLTITNATTTSISVSWTIDNVPGLNHFRVRHMDLSTGTPYFSNQLNPTQRSFTVGTLQADTTYSICIQAYNSLPTVIVLTCQVQKTDGGAWAGGRVDDEDSSSDTGIIIGVVIGAVILLAIIAAIVILFLRKRTTNKDLPPSQPHVFTASELPSMSANSRHFSRPPEKQQPKVGRALDGNINVTVISDGHTGPTSPGGRHSVGSYQFLDEKHPNPNPAIVPKGHSEYSNDTDSRPLPSAPHGSFGGYYNSNGRLPQDTSTNVYNHIDQ